MNDKNQETLMIAMAQLVDATKIPPDTTAPWPSYLTARYVKQGIVSELKRDAIKSTPAIGALIRAALQDEEEDVRRDALAALSDLNPEIAKPVLFAAVFDDDPAVCEVAFELLWRMDQPLARLCSPYLLNHENASLRETVDRYLKATKEDPKKLVLPPPDRVGIP